MQLSILDQSPIVEGSTGRQALANSIELAQHAERLGYHRYWVAEHHGTGGLASPSPEVLISAAGAHTSSIRIGSGGVMLPHYSAFKVAENFSMLAGLYPGRVDIGLGRANGSDPHTAVALRRHRHQTQSAEDFPEQMEDLLGYLGNNLRADHPHARLAKTLPGGVDRPEPWLLGSSPDSAVLAARLGLPYCFADFINPHQEALTRFYRDQFRPSVWAAEPRVMVTALAIAADTTEEANELALSWQLALVRLRQGRFGPLPSVESAREFFRQEPQLADPQLLGRRLLTGTGEDVSAQIMQLAEGYRADEVMLLTNTHSHAARLRSYALVAQAVGRLEPQVV